MDEKYTITVSEAAKMLGIGRNLAYNMARSGQIPALRLGGRIVVLKQPFMKMLQSDIIPQGQPGREEKI
ncbi:helix-turn-helix domain-containing protein [Neomoorella thermoacetica]|uniref:helix-turn-helix domain-containing protein n=1 Tax=Neomoorella thermoacetica TaxID=1525 RepID=UPI0008FB4B16|nr:helix-turn-helix domain-containing protein [Moorella thermoacetica]APC09053.1 helix-turn-helix domain protein [Moorella thermoacetica]OIQ55000.1 helix-turn-helix domain protein [Moorella thermoacetica]